MCLESFLFFYASRTPTPTTYVNLFCQFIDKYSLNCFSKMSRWTEDQTLKFVENYIKHPCLYNIKLNIYKNKSAKEAALSSISSSMEIPDFGPMEAKIKIRNIKSTYSQELKKIKESNRSGAGTGDIYKPNLKWFSILHDVLQSCNIECRNTQCNLAVENIVNDENSSAVSNTVENNDVAIISEKKNPRKRNIRDLDRLMTKVKDVSNSLNTCNMDEFDSFGANVAAQLKKMPLNLALKSQMFIQTHLINTRMEHMSDGNTSSTPSTSYQTELGGVPATPTPSPVQESEILYATIFTPEQFSEHEQNMYLFSDNE